MTDEVTKVREKFDLTSIFFGKFNIERRNDVAPEDCVYQIEIIGLNEYDATVSLGIFTVNDNETFELPATIDIERITTLNWYFGDVMYLNIANSPTVTAIAHENAYGLVPNDMHLFYDGEPELKRTAIVRVLNSNSLSKIITHADGTPVSNENDDVKAKVGEELIYHIRFVNVSGREMDLTKTHFTDTITVGGLDTTQDILLEFSHMGKDGQQPTSSAVLEEARIDAMDWRDGEFSFTFSDGIMEIDDVLIFTYKVTVSPDFYKSVDTSTSLATRNNYALYNKIAVMTDIEEENQAETDKFYAIMYAYTYIQKSIVGVGFTTTHAGSSTSYQTTMFEKKGFGDSLSQLTGVPSYYLGSNNYTQSEQDVVIFYNLTLVNSGDSTCAVDFSNLRDSKDFPGTIVGIYSSSILSSAGTYDQVWQNSGTQKNIRVSKATSFNLSNAMNFNDNTAYPSVLEDGAMRNYSFIANGSSNGTLGMNSSGTGTGTLRLYPGKAANMVIAVKISGNTFNQEMLTNKATVTVNAESGGSWEAKEMKVDCPTISNSSLKLESSNGDFVQSGNTLSSSVSIKAPVYEVGINKSVAGFYDANDWGGYTNPGTLLNADSKTPFPSDYIVWQLDITNTNDFYMSGFTITDVLPYPYEAVAVYITNSEDSGYQFCWNTSNTVSNISISTPYVNPSNKPEQDSPYQTITIKCDGSSFYNSADGTSSKANNTIAPGKTLTIQIVSRPSPTYEPEGAKLRTYENQVRNVVDNNGIIVGGVSQGQPYYNAANQLRGAKDYASIKIGGAYSAVSYLTVDNKLSGLAHEVGVGNTSKDYVTVNALGTFTYGINFKSTADYSFHNVSMINRLPITEDRGVVNVDADRDSEFRVRLADNPNFKITKTQKSGSTMTLVERDWSDLNKPWDYYVQYNTQAPDERFSAPMGEDWVDVGTGGWTNTHDENTTVFRVIYNNNFIVEAGAALLINFDGVVDNPGAVAADEIAWDSFGYVYYTDISGFGAMTLQQAEPSKVGVRIIGAKIRLKKVDENAFGLAGAIFGIYDNAECTNDHLIQTITTNSTGIATSRNLLLQPYWVKEISAPSPYTASDTIYPLDLSNAERDEIVLLLTESDGVTLQGISNEINPVVLNIKKVMNANNKIEDETGTVTISVTGKFMKDDGTVGVTDETYTAVFTKQDRIDGKVVTIENVIAGYEYVMRETNDADVEYIYDVSYRVVGKEIPIDFNSDPDLWPIENSRGVDRINGEDIYIPTHENEYMTVTNTEPAPDLKVTKKVFGDYLLDESFEISITGVFADTYDLGNENLGVTTKQYSIGTTNDFSSKTKGIVNWAEKTITIPGILYGFTYEIEETGGNEYYTTKYYTAKVPEGTSDDDKNFTEVEEVEVLTLRTPIEIQIENTRREPGELTLTKTVTGATQPVTENFTFEVTGVFSGSKQVETKTYVLTDQETITVDRLIYGLNYTIKEALNGSQTSLYDIYYDGIDTSYYDSSVLMEPGKKIQIFGTDQNIETENRYDAYGSYLFEALKSVDGIMLDTVAGEFEFVVNEIVNGEEVPIATGTNDVNGKIVFTSLQLGAAQAIEYKHNVNGEYDPNRSSPQMDSDLGTHTYVIREIPGVDEYILYSQSSYTVEVVVTDEGDGTLSTVAQLVKIDNELLETPVAFTGSAARIADGAEFLNYFTRDVEVLKFHASPEWVLEYGVFELFEGSRAPENLLAEAISNKEGVAIFEKLKTGRYVLVEKTAPAGYLRIDNPIIFDIVLGSDNELHIEVDETNLQASILQFYVTHDLETDRIEVKNDLAPPVPRTADSDKMNENLIGLSGSLMILLMLVSWLKKQVKA